MELNYGKIDLANEATKIYETDECERLFASARERFPGYQDAQRHRQVVGCGMTKGAVGRASSSDRHDYAAIATPVTSAQVVKA
jgi:hypothetical protein